jgi:hypothetical protein
MLVTQSRIAQRILERLGAGFDRDDGGAEQFHAIDVGGLALDVLAAHVDHALHAVAGGDGGSGDAVLAGAGFGDDARLAHALGEHGLADAVVHLVGAGVIEVFALEVDLGAAEQVGPAFGVVDRRRAADEMLQLVIVFGPEGRIGLGGSVGGLQFIERAKQRLGHEDATVGAEMALGVGEVILTHRLSVRPPRRQRFSSDP